MDQQDIDNRFSFHPAGTPQRQGDHSTVREACRRVATEWDSILPDGREKSLAVTKLEEAMFWANAAVARSGDGA